MYKFIVFILINLVYLQSVLAQSTLTGKITDHNGPIPYVTISIDSGAIGVVTNQDGKFSIDLLAGIHVIEVRSVGYKIFKKQVVINAGSTYTLDIKLNSKTTNLDQVTVTGNLKPTFISESAVKIEVLTQKQLNLFLPSASASVVESVSLINGVQEVVACGVCFTNNISINGLEGPYTAILIDGTPMFGNLASVYGLNGIPNSMIEQIEIIKGPNSTLYGSEAVAGVINIITKSPKNQPKLAFDLMQTSHLETFGNLSYSSTLKNIGHFYLGVNGARMHDFEDQNKDGFGDRINLDRYSLFSKIDFKRKSGRPFSLAAKVYYEDRRNGVEEYTKDLAYRDIRGNDSIYGESIYTKRLELFGTYHFNKIESLRIDYSYSHHNQDSYYGNVPYLASQNIGFANLIKHQTYQKHDITSGLTGRIQTYDDNTIGTASQTGDSLTNKPQNQFIPGVFIQDEIELSKKLDLMLGARFDHYGSHGPIFSPRANLKFSPNPLKTFRINSGTGFRVVNLFTEDHAFVTGQRVVEIKEELKPEQSVNMTFNYNQIYFINDQTGSFDIDVFYTHFSNKIIPSFEEQGKIIYQNAKGNAVSKGIGLNLQQSIKKLNFNLSYTLQRVTRTDEFKTKSAIEFAPDWTANALINYTFSKHDITLSYNNQFTGPMQLPEVFDVLESGELSEVARDTRSRMFSTHNFKISKVFSKKLTLYGGVMNLTNYRQEISPLVGFNSPGAPSGFSSNFDTAYAYAPIHGREIYIGFIYSLAKK